MGRGTRQRWPLGRMMACVGLTAVISLVDIPLADATGSTAPGTVTIYGDPSINNPEPIVAGPDGALWFGNIGNNSIGRITTAGVVTN